VGIQFHFLPRISQMVADFEASNPPHNVGGSRVSNNISGRASQAAGIFNHRWHRLPQIGIRTRKPQAMGLGSEPLIILRIGFIQIESVKSVVKDQGIGFGCGSAAQGISA
jgi:hypothetical protein